MESSTQTAAKSAILTIGYGSNREVDELFFLLKEYGVEYLVDIRSKPYSKFRPEYSKDALIALTKTAGLKYVYMGDTLGGRPSDESCYTDGKADYDLIKTKAWFKAGIDHLEQEWKQGHGIAVMCSELEPEHCHRSKLLGVVLESRGNTVGHIDGDGAVLSHFAVMQKITKGQGNLFGQAFTSKKKYINEAW